MDCAPSKRIEEEWTLLRAVLGALLRAGLLPGEWAVLLLFQGARKI